MMRARSRKRELELPPVRVRAVTSGAVSSGAMSVGALAVGALAAGAFAIGALAIGALAIGRVKVGRAEAQSLRFGKVEIDDLTVKRLHVVDASTQDEDETP